MVTWWLLTVFLNSPGYLGSRIVGFEVEAFRQGPFHRVVNPVYTPDLNNGPFRCAACSVKHKPDGNKKNPDGTQKLLTCAQEGTSEIGDFLMLDTSGKAQTIFWTYDVLFEVCLKNP